MVPSYVDDLPLNLLKGKHVLVRAELNVPMTVPLSQSQPEVVSVDRISHVIKTVKYLYDHEVSCVCICGHLGRPTGPDDAQLSLRPLAAVLQKLLECPVQFVSDCIGSLVQSAVDSTAGSGTVILLENLRFYQQEEANDYNFAKLLAAPFDVYVNEAFGACHRSHASIDAITRYIPVAVGGLDLKNELLNLDFCLEHPRHPFAALIGGSKMDTKIGVIYKLLGLVDKLLIGGAMVFTFLQAKGVFVGKSLVDQKNVPIAEDILREAIQNNVRVVLATDFLAASDFQSEDVVRVTVDDFPVDLMGLDIGNTSIRTFCNELEGCETVVWNGPMGLTEFDRFSEGTVKMIDFIGSLKSTGVTTVVCGGDTVAAVERYGVANFTHVSSGGGATLEYIELGHDLPGVRALADRGAAVTLERPLPGYSDLFEPTAYPGVAPSATATIPSSSYMSSESGAVTGGQKRKADRTPPSPDFGGLFGQP